MDVLTLTATPIPRTLYLSLMGGRDMSVINTPPAKRLPVKTRVLEYDDGLIREAIAKETRRGGQAYFVHNRVQGIEKIGGRLQKLIPAARIAVGHGQMREKELEKTMLEFIKGNYTRISHSS